MKPRTIAYILVLLVTLVFVIANWRVITLPTELNLLFARINAPLGVLILIIGATIFAIDFIAHALSRSAWRSERLSLARDIESLRLRADGAEATRIQELRDLVERELAAIRAQLEQLSGGSAGAGGGLGRGPQR